MPSLTERLVGPRRAPTGRLSALLERRPDREYGAILPISAPKATELDYAPMPSLDAAAGIVGDVLRGAKTIGRGAMGIPQTVPAVVEAALSTSLAGGLLGKVPEGALAMAAGRKQGQTQLADMLRSREFDAINFGQLSHKKFKEVNDVLKGNGHPPLADRDIVIPANVVRKLAKKRGDLGKMSPDAVADFVFSVFHNKGSRVGASRHGHIAELLLPKDHMSRLGYIARNPQNNDTVVKSAYPRESERLKR